LLRLSDEIHRQLVREHRQHLFVVVLRLL